MNIDKDKLQGLLEWLFENIERVEKELLAHRATFLLLKASGAFDDLDQILEQARHNASPVLDQKYEKIRQTMGRLLDEADSDQALEQLIRGWKPQGPTN
jgi:hypothetical protein